MTSPLCVADDISTSSTRRVFLRRGGLLAGAIALGSWNFGGGVATATASVGLTPERRRAFAGLADLVVTGPSLRLGRDAVEETVTTFESAYLTWSRPERGRADRVLDALDQEFRGRDRVARRAALSSSAGNPRAAQLAYGARNLIAVAVGGDADGRPLIEVPA